MAYTVLFSTNARAAMARLESDAAAASRLKKVRKALALLEENPWHPGLRANPLRSLSGPAGESVFEAVVEDLASDAWRMWFWTGPGRAEITVLEIGPHPD